MLSVLSFFVIRSILLVVLWRLLISNSRCLLAGLANSTVFAPLISANCLKNFVALGQTGTWRAGNPPPVAPTVH